MLLVCTLFGLLAVSCKSYKEEYDKTAAETARLQQELNSLKEEEKLTRGDYSKAIEDLNSIEDTLRAISEREKTIQQLSKSKELSGNLSQRQNIIAKLEALKMANEKSNAEARALQNKMKTLKVENEQLRKMMAASEQKILEKERQIEEQNTVIADMRTALSKMEGKLLETQGELTVTYDELKRERDNLAKTNENLERTVAELQGKTNFINDQAQAYIACGTKKELRQNSIVDVPLFGKPKLDKEYKKNIMLKGSKVSYFDNAEFECGSVGGNIELVLPERDKSTYEVKGSKLIIKNPKQFWALDKVVVLVKEKE